MADMIDSPQTYFAQLVPPRDPLLVSLENEATKENIPVVGPVVGEWLYLLARIGNARKIPEPGTATGYSSIFPGRACRINQGHVLTLEFDPGLARRARKNIKHAGLKDTVEVLTGDALTEMEKMDSRFDSEGSSLSNHRRNLLWNKPADAENSGKAPATRCRW